MHGQKIGYIRVSSEDQNTDRQLDGQIVDRTFIDRVSGKSIDRPALTECLQYIRSGDVLIIHSMDRLARNLDDLRSLVNQLTSRDIRVVFIKEGLSFTGDDSPMSTLLLSVMGAFAEFERALIRERQREGIDLAKKRGAYKGRVPSLNPEQIIIIKQQLAIGVPKAKLSREFNVSRQTIYSLLK